MSVTEEISDEAMSEADRAVIKLKAQRDRLRKFQKRVRRAHSGGTRMRRG